MAKNSNNPKPGQMVMGLPSIPVPTGPVESLGMMFPSDTERRKYAHKCYGEVRHRRKAMVITMPQKRLLRVHQKSQAQ